MKVSPTKENILKKIRKALSQSVPVPFSNLEGMNEIYHPSKQELEIEYAEQFTRLQGRFSYCQDKSDLAKQLELLVESRGWKEIFCAENELKKQLDLYGYTNFNSEDLLTCEASITSCEGLVARTGSILLSSQITKGRTASVYAPIHICVAYTSQLVYDIKEGLNGIKEKHGGKTPSFITLATGPSRTADIEKTLVVGVHGPKEVFLFLVEDGIRA